MKQLTQQLKSGKMEILEVPFPLLDKGQILVRNHFSIISAGTEGKTVLDARKGYIAKARSRQKEVKQVVEMIKASGLKETYSFVMNKLDAPSALGYSCAGEVIAVAKDVRTFQIGDWVACGGKSASHADVVAIPLNLAVKVPKTIDLKHACFTTLGAIALQGIRQSELKIGETCLIIGMGLIGQLTAKILMAAGVNVIGMDTAVSAVNQSISNGIPDVFERNQAGLTTFIEEKTEGQGVDIVIITASSSSLDPIEFAGQSARKKGKIIIVGAVPTGFDRTNFYKKELDVRMSMSYGPGRGDLSYEENGLDYPYAYVRWTENRNMKAFVDLLASKKIEISSLISHVFPLENAEKAYEIITSKSEEFNGILLQYEENIPNSVVELNKTNYKQAKGIVGLIGAGNFAQGVLLPKMKNRFHFEAILTNRANIAKYVGEKYAFRLLANTKEAIFSNENIDTVFITTRHDSHAFYVLEGIKANKNIFVEKPLALTEQELEKIKQTIVEQNYSKHLIVGFNRRFAPAITKLKSQLIPKQTKAINIRVNAGNLPLEHWVNNPTIGGGRIIGEACHFIDLAQFISSSKIVSVSATTLDKELVNTVNIQLSFENGSFASISYLSNGNKKVEKEWIEVFCGGTVYQIDDFMSLKIIGDKEQNIKFKNKDKGHQDELEAFYQSIVSGNESIIPFDEIYNSTLATFKVLESIKENRKIVLED